jgi:GAF domain-containing protein
MGITVFTPAPFPPDEHARNQAALRSGLLGRVNDPDLVRISARVRDALQVGWCGISVVLSDIQHVVASSGGMMGIFRRSTSLCSYAIFAPHESFVVLDAAADERFAGNPYVDDRAIRFFAAMAIRDRASYAIGALCTVDDVARAGFSDEDDRVIREGAKDIAAMLV